MANLFDRLIGNNLPSTPTESEEKISVHAFTASIDEWDANEVTGAELVDWYNLNASQTNEAVVLKDYYNAAPDKIKWLLVFKDWLFCGEIRLGVPEGDMRYVTRAQFIDRLEREIVNQGGVVP